MNKTLLIGTNNRTKFEHMRSFLHQLHDWRIVSLADLDIEYDVDETGTTYAENALLKAQTYAKLSGLPTIADDSGLEIDALNGEPGVYSSRYAGANKTDHEKVQYILDKMMHVPFEKRKAQFVSVVAFASPTGETKLYHGLSKGSIAFELREPMRKGFPYLSIYIPEGFDKTVTQLDALSIPYPYHRTKPMNEFMQDLFNLK